MENFPLQRRKNFWRLFRAAVSEMLNQKRKSADSQEGSTSSMDLASLYPEPELFGVLLNGADAAVYYSSKTIEDLLGYPSDSIIGASLLDLIHPKDRNGFHQRYLHFLANIRDMEEPAEADLDDNDEDCCRFLHFSRWRKALPFKIYFSRVHCIEMRQEEFAGNQAEGGHPETVQRFSVLLQAVKQD